MAAEDPDGVPLSRMDTDWVAVPINTSIVILSTSAPTDPIPFTYSAGIHYIPSISPIAVDSISSTSSATLAPGILNSNIEVLLPLPVKMFPQKPTKKKRRT
ncbi:hypothetical protein K1T71_012945 [Dendrolimus kikuchii]|uniref:Uncharacterized protein n=1 Tax=Dendrolimus kikuchii TaxID=765133 RepID=A0ACC1CII6_9NEOP|nr:hypothetical protein K1T71_012945 [Dendrolimus kikuchii]